MATNKPRILITLEPKQYNVLKELSELNNTPMSRIVREYLDVVIEPLERTVENLKIMKSSEQMIKAELRKVVDFANDEMINFVSNIEKDKLN